MTHKKPVRSGIFALLLLTLSCNIFHDVEPDDLLAPSPRAQILNGYFRVKLIPPQGSAEGYSSFAGRIHEGPIPPPDIWEAVESSGQCRLMVKRLPICEPQCGGETLCVEDGQCQSYPSPVSVGTVQVEGLKAKTGETAFSMEPVEFNYLPPKDFIPDFPPCAEGDTVSLTAGGDSSVDPFTLTVTGISPLEILNDSIRLEDGRPINLSWKSPDQSDNATISVVVVINYYSEIKGKIECNDISDNGFLEVPASLLDELKALGMSGFPRIEIIRRSANFNPIFKIEFAIESRVKKMLTIPGLISCNNDTDCPEGHTCQWNFQCK